jgi:sugar transferase EpsL
MRKGAGGGMYRIYGKRFLDLGLAIPSLVMLAPVLCLLALVVRCRIGSPVFFLQRRPGFLGRPFTLYKFRTMSAAVDATGMPLPDADRLTPLGRFLRSISLDELPELFNVLKGEMSLVGPRPLLMHYLDRYSPAQSRRHEVKPGLTGWAQVHGRNRLAWEERFALDIWYVEHCSLWIDVKIILLTLWKTVKREGITQAGHATADEFRGSKS